MPSLELKWNSPSRHFPAMNRYGLICQISRHLWTGCEKRESLPGTKNAASLVLDSDMGGSAPFSRNLHVFSGAERRTISAQFGQKRVSVESHEPLGVLHRTCLTVANRRSHG
jgi:hypothetical protein